MAFGTCCLTSRSSGRRCCPRAPRSASAPLNSTVSHHANGRHLKPATGRFESAPHCRRRPGPCDLRHIVVVGRHVSSHRAIFGSCLGRRRMVVVGVATAVACSAKGSITICIGCRANRRRHNRPMRTDHLHIHSMVNQRFRTIATSMMANNSFERTVWHGGPRLSAARSVWPAAQLSR